MDGPGLCSPPDSQRRAISAGHPRSFLVKFRERAGHSVPLIFEPPVLCKFCNRGAPRLFYLVARGCFVRRLGTILCALLLVTVSQPALASAIHIPASGAFPVTVLVFAELPSAIDSPTATWSALLHAVLDVSPASFYSIAAPWVGVSDDGRDDRDSVQVVWSASAVPEPPTLLLLGLGTALLAIFPLRKWSGREPHANKEGC